MTKCRLLNYRKDEWARRTFFYALLAASAIFIPIVILGGGIFSYMGDFDAQQIPFYVHCHDAVRNGTFAFDWGTELGTNFIGSYTYYTLCSPFFWLTIPFPGSWVPYLMGPLFILKFVLSAMAAYAYLRYMTKTGEGAMVGSLLYAFSGWSLYNIFYNQFHESFIMFPLLMLAMEKTVREKKRGVFALAVAMSAIVNYYFFVGMVLFAILYWLIRTLCHGWKMTWKTFFVLLAEGVIGVLMSVFVLLPSALCVFGMSRAGDTMHWSTMLVYPDFKIYLCIIQSFFFPPELPGLQSFYECKTVSWQSLSLFFPFLGPVALLPFIWHKVPKKHWLAELLMASGLCMFIPVLNASFTLLRNTYYARWFMMPILMMSLASGMIIEEANVKDLKWSYRITGAISLLFVAVMALFPSIDEEGNWQIGLYNRVDTLRPILFFFWSGVVLVQFLMMWLLFNKNKDKKLIEIVKPISLRICAFAVIIALSSVAIGQAVSGSRSNMDKVRTFASFGEEYATEDGERTSIYPYVNNLNMVSGTEMSSISCFHSVVSGGTSDFYETMLGVYRGVSSPEVMTNKAYYALTSVKYLYMDPTYVDSYEETYKNENFYDETWKEAYDTYGYAMLPGLKEIKQVDDFIVYENEYYVPMGQGYRYYILKTDYAALSKKEQQTAMLLAIVVPDDEVSAYSKMLFDYKTCEIQGEITDEEYYDICKKKSENSCYSFKQNNNGFEADMRSEEKQLVLFSVPFETNAWTATVNGQEAKIQVVDGGLMAVEVDKGDNHIEFHYEVPGMKAGLLISCIGLILFAAWCGGHAIAKKIGEEYAVPENQTVENDV